MFKVLKEVLRPVQKIVTVLVAFPRLGNMNLCSFIFKSEDVVLKKILNFLQVFLITLQKSITFYSFEAWSPFFEKN